MGKNPHDKESLRLALKLETAIAGESWLIENKHNMSFLFYLEMRIRARWHIWRIKSKLKKALKNEVKN